MSDTAGPPVDRFRAAPAAEVSTASARVIWPVGGVPAAFDAAASALFDCFDQPLSIPDLAADLVDAVGLSEPEAMTTAFGFVSGLVQSGHLIREGLKPMPVSLLSYPPSASP